MSGNVIRIEPLNSQNYDTWKLQIRAILIKNDLWAYVSGASQCPLAEAAEIEKWKIADQKASADILLSMAPSELGLISECKTSRDIWLKLESTFQSKGPARKATLLKRVALARMKEGESARDHMNEFFDAVTKLKEINVTIGDDLLAILLLYSLPDSFETFRCALETRDALPTPDVLRVKILEEDQSRKAKTERDEQNAMYVRPKKNNVNGKFERVAREDKVENAKAQKQRQKQGCFKCGRFGHYARNCRSNANHAEESEGRKEKSLFNCVDVTLNCFDISSEWCLDSGCTSHMSAYKEGFVKMKSIRKSLCLANGEMSEISGIGDVKIKVANKGQMQPFIIRDVMYVKDLRTNLLSISKLTNKGYQVHFHRDEAFIMDGKNEVCRATRKGNLYFINSIDSVNSAEEKIGEIDLWHQKLGHLNEHDLKLLADTKGAHGIEIKKGQRLSTCAVCLSEKQTRNSFSSRGDNRTSELLEVVHSDVCGPMRVNSHSNARYFVTFIDDYSRYCEVHFLKQKSDVLGAFKKFKSSSELLTGKKIKFLQSDNGTEYLNKEFNDYLEKAGIRRRLTAPHTPQQNGVSERKNRTLLEMARCMMKQAGVPPVFWAEAVNTANYLRNRCPTRSLNGKLPIKIWTGKTPSIKHLRTFGTRAYVLIKDKTNGKLDSRSDECILVGYSEEAKAYRLWSPKKRHVIISRDVKFTEDFYGEAFEPIIREDLEPQYEYEMPIGEQEYPEQRERQSQTSSQNANDTFQTQNTNADAIEDSEEDMDDFEGFEDCEFINAVFNDEPTTCGEAMNSPDGLKWRLAIEDEFLAQILNGTWEITEQPDDKKVIANRFVFRTKMDDKKKARLVAKGCSQRPGEDFSDTYSPVVRSSTIRLMSAVAVENDLEIHQMDFVTAYLNGDLKERVFMHVPDYLEEVLHKLSRGETVGTSKEKNQKAVEIAEAWLRNLKKYKNPVCRLVKAIYGLRQSGLLWYQKLSHRLQQLGLIPSKQDPCLFINRKGEKITLVTVYVDDLLIATDDKEQLCHIKKSLAESFEMKDLGRVSRCLGIEFDQDLENGQMSLKQKEYTESVLARFNMQNCKPVVTPLEQQCKLDKPLEPDATIMRKHPYQSLIGALMYLAVSTRPDIAYAVNFLSQFNSNYNTEHWKAAKRVLRYLKGTIDHGLKYTKSNIQLYAVVDADWGSNLSDRRSYSGFAFIMSSGAISWEARKQRTVALSSTEAELLAITEASKEALYLRRIFEEIRLPKNCITIFNDSQSAQKLIQSVGYHSRTKHIDVRHQFLQQYRNSGYIKLEYKRTEDMTADVLTKGLGSSKHQQHIRELGVAEIL